MRGLEVSDIFAAARILKELNLKEKIKSVALESENKNIRVMGFDIVWTVMENATTPNAEKMIYGFVGNILEKTNDEIKHMNPTTMLDELLDNISVEEWKAFFKRVLRLIREN